MALTMLGHAAMSMFTQHFWLDHFAQVASSLHRPGECTVPKKETKPTPVSVAIEEDDTTVDIPLFAFPTSPFPSQMVPGPYSQLEGLQESPRFSICPACFQRGILLLSAQKNLLFLKKEISARACLGSSPLEHGKLR